MLRSALLRRSLSVLVLGTAFFALRTYGSGVAHPIGAASAQEMCGGPATDPWVIEQADRVRNDDGLFHFAVAEFGPPIACDGVVADEFDGASFGRVTFRFTQDVTFERETMPPSVLIVTLGRASGFTDPATVQAAVRSYANASGLSIVWDAPEREVDGAVLTERFWDPDPGMNGSVSLTWSSGVLVSVRVSQAP